MINNQNAGEDTSLPVCESRRMLHVLLGALGGVIVTSILAWIILLEVQNAFLSSASEAQLVINRPVKTSETVGSLEPDFSGYEIREVKATTEGENSVFSLLNQEQIVNANLNDLLSSNFQADGNGLQVDILSRDAKAGQLYLLVTETDGPGAYTQVVRFDVVTQSVTALPNISPVVARGEYQVLADNIHMISWGGDSVGKLFVNNLQTDESKLFYTAPDGTSFVSALKPVFQGYDYAFDVNVTGDYVKVGLYDTTKDERGKAINMKITDDRDESWISDEDYGEVEFYPQFVKSVALPLTSIY
jgi:hypothetical protein